ncbi:MAG: hypothetical protein A2289_13850 [Deltaproteobacteria bacterium RIFOXYA12_FULL_58_15]|nr:MAG: hypothetical protein A2289_13850 [Deltaproteobacteria bacterium RIFOXYA12_FULL_58_15]OGR12382.1 MAG: hypothetical protein A2341_23860 [Deltaproteobacteria bacterium RIFOXYB12_FULL_58_9]
MKLVGKKALMVIAPAGFQDEELFVPRQLLESAGVSVTVASTRTGGLKGMMGGRATAMTTVDRVNVGLFDAVLLVGGDGARDHLWSHSRLQALVREASKAGKIVGAICLAPVVLARAGLLADKETAVWRSPEALAELKEARVRVADADVLHAGNLITANGPLAAERWANAIIAAIAEMQRELPDICY